MPGVARQYVVGGGSNGGREPTNEECGIREVWKETLEDEFETIRQVVKHYPYVAMDSEFPGVVAKPIGEFVSSADFQYQLLRCNVDLLKIIQLGLSFFDENGKSAPGISTWQFNFEFNLTEDMYAQDSIDLLQNSGLQFSRHQEEGINPVTFAELLMTSGVVILDEIKFLSFHSGYDFGYLIKLLTNQNLPLEESKFFEVLYLYFPVIYDVKYLMKSCKNLKGGLQEVSEQLELERIGPQHQAGSDSLLTGSTFFKMRELYFEGHIDNEKYCGHLYGLGTQHVQNGNEGGASNQSPPVGTAAAQQQAGAGGGGAAAAAAAAAATNSTGSSNNAGGASSNNNTGTPTNAGGDGGSGDGSNSVGGEGGAATDNGHDGAGK